jgi:curved DNA-binding protein CbpA
VLLRAERYRKRMALTSARTAGHSSAVLDSHDLRQPSLLRVGRAGIRTEPFAAETQRSLDEQQNMTTLYDLLGALPGDDADDLRDAFRRAVKDVHPDISPNDPDAALKFRLLVYAMEVLRDPEQRAAYDHLLELAQQELVSQQTAAKLRNFAFAMRGLASATVGAVGLSILLAPTPEVLAPARQIDGFPHASSGIASESPSAQPGLNNKSTAATRDAPTTKPAEVQDDFLSRWGATDIYAKVDHDAEIPKPVEEQNAPLPRSDANDTSAAAGGDAETATPAKAPDDLPLPSGADDYAATDRSAETRTVMKTPETPIVPPSGPNPPAPHDDADRMKALVKPDDRTDSSAVMHARGIVAYRNGDLKLALADFNRAIELNPMFMLAYANRGIVLYRMGKLDLALADVARARHIDRARSAAAFHRRRRGVSSLIESPAWMQAAGL